jgi:hypothetical protein
VAERFSERREFRTDLPTRRGGDMRREVSVRVVLVGVGERASLEENERVARVEWNGRTKLHLIIVQDPASSTSRMAMRRDAAS